MTTATRQSDLTIPLTPIERETLQQISTVEHLDEEALLKKFVREGLIRYKIEFAARAYARGELNLSGAARYAGIGVEEMMHELEQRGIDYGPTVEQFLDGLDTLAEDFGVEELHQVATEMRQEEGL